MNQRFQPQRKSIRLENYDYSSAGAYFVTICTQWQGFDWLGTLSQDGVVLNAAGQMVEAELHNLPKRFPNLELDTFIIMPDHIHAILVLSEPTPQLIPQNSTGEPCVRPATQPRQKQISTQFDLPIMQSVTGDDKHRPYLPHGTYPNSLGRMVQAFKSLTTNLYSRGVRELGWTPFEKRFWHRDFWERVLRDDIELEERRQYTLNNPIRALKNEGTL